MQTAVQLRKEKWASKESEPDRFVRMANHQERKESELDRLVRMATHQERKEALVPADAPLVQIVDYLIAEAIKMRASDIHVEPQEGAVVIRNRIDGVLRKKHRLPKSLQAPLISRIKIMANMDIAEKRLPQDGRIKVSFSERKLDLRISIIPSLHGEKAVMRLLDLEATSIPLESLGFTQEIYESVLSLIEKPQGVIFITGPTGSGKTSTLYACLNSINSEDINIITLEDPIEYEMEGITQIAINEKIGLTFAETLRSVLRQDPDMIMVGEMRDAETARIAMQASLTGHLVFSTLHTSDSVSAVTRLVDLGIPRYLITSSLSGVLAQRLVRTICPKCKEIYQPSLGEKVKLGIDPADDFGPIYLGKGCPHCDFTGFYGRMGIFELLILDDEIRTLITSGVAESSIRERVQTKGMQSLRKDGLRRIKEGNTTPREVLKVTSM